MALTISRPVEGQQSSDESDSSLLSQPSTSVLYIDTKGDFDANLLAGFISRSLSRNCRSTKNVSQQPIKLCPPCYSILRSRMANVRHLLAADIGMLTDALVVTRLSIDYYNSRSSSFANLPQQPICSKVESAATSDASVNSLLASNPSCDTSKDSPSSTKSSMNSRIDAASVPCRQDKPMPEHFTCSGTFHSCRLQSRSHNVVTPAKPSSIESDLHFFTSMRLLVVDSLATLISPFMTGCPFQAHHKPMGGLE
ncbi:unnamed protein product [Protopolystoma xenopodis]|uniref:Uncharacterized protein n=1 Tax=Protopolystoma xenopodis TaxID=117903 RepID=A0A448WUK3_9PLAT|nr:unnamed protein product [Protopolystoma xenopodis]